MLAALQQRWNRRTDAWLLARQGRDGHRVETRKGRIYILPTPLGFVFALLVFGMLLGAMNYSNSMAFMLAFLLGALFLLAMHHTHRNLMELVIERRRVEPPFVGGQAVFMLRVSNRAPEVRWAVGASGERGPRPAWFADIPPAGSALLPIPVDAPRRGRLRLMRATVFTRHPFGLFHAWAVLHMDLTTVVYPAPAVDAPQPPLAEGDGRGRLDARGQDDFAGLREYRGGESPRHIAWKAFARGQDLLVKEFSGALHASQWFDFDTLDGMDTERRLAVLCRWVLDAERDGMQYGLRLPGVSIAPGTGEPHRAACLEALALFGEDDAH